MADRRRRRLGDGREIDVGRNGGLRKLCGCPRRGWAKCPHAWHVNYRWRGQDYRFSLDKYLGRRVATKTEADTEVERIRVAIRAGRFAREPPLPVSDGPAADGTRFREFAHRWLERERQGRIPTARDDAGRIKGLAAIELLPGRRLGDKAVAAVCEDDLETAVQRLRARGYAASTVNHYIQTIKAMERWGLRKGHLARPWLSLQTTLKRRRSAQRHRRLTPDAVDKDGHITEPGEERRLLAAANPWLQRLIIAALDTGCRRGELLALRWSDVDLVRGELTVRAEQAKSGKARVLPISPRLRGVLTLVRLGPDGVPHGPASFVFGDEMGRRVSSPKTAWQTCVLKAHGYAPAHDRKQRCVDAAARRRYAEIDLHFHDLRHEAGSRLVEAGWPLHHVQEMLGHADLQTTSIYLNVTRTGLAESMRRFGNAPALHVVAKTPANEPRPSRKAEPRPAPQVPVN